MDLDTRMNHGCGVYQHVTNNDWAVGCRSKHYTWIHDKGETIAKWKRKRAYMLVSRHVFMYLNVLSCPTPQLHVSPLSLSLPFSVFMCIFHATIIAKRQAPSEDASRLGLFLRSTAR